MAGPDPTAYSATEIPVIDFSRVEEPSQRASVIKQLVYAFENFGFFEAINSCVSVERIDDAFNVSRAFFEQPVEKKRAAIVSHQGNKSPEARIFKLGWQTDVVFNGVTCHKENINHYHYHQSPDFPRIHSNGDSNDNRPLEVGNEKTIPNVYPTTVPDYREKVDNLMESLGEFGDQLLDLISESLGLPPSFIRKQYHDNSVPRTIIMHYYPKSTTHELDETGTQMGLTEHKDATIISIVSQGFDAAGLQINVTGNKWITALPSRGGLVVNVGEILQVWSNGRYKSILHRVINNKSKDRFSFAYFIMPVEILTSEHLITSIPELTDAQHPQRYKPFTLYEYFQRRRSDNCVNVLTESFETGR